MLILGKQHMQQKTSECGCARATFATNAMVPAHQNVESGGVNMQQTQASARRAGQICDECGGDGPPKGGVWKNDMALKTSNCVGTRGKCATNAMKTAHQKVDSGKTKLQ